MYELSILIKPASSLCDLRCRYCFYRDEAEHRSIPSHGVMTNETAEALIARAYGDAAFAGGRAVINFAFQGGEPTLAGLEFFKSFCETSDRYDPERKTARWSIQTNGVALSRDRRWAEFFRERGFLVGLSVDGLRNLHDANRIFPDGGGSFDTAVAAAGILAEEGVDFNILTVVNSLTARHAASIYSFYKKKGWRHLQFIPCLDTQSETAHGKPKNLTPRGWAAFLMNLFDLWHADAEAGNYISVSPFEDYLNILAGYEPRGCESRGVCSIQNVVEADGSVYPCDFYATDEYYLGNIKEKSFRELLSSPAAAFIEKTNATRAGGFARAGCAGCGIYTLCRGGCARRLDAAGNYPFCGAQKEFWQYAGRRFASLARKLLQGKL